MYFNLVRRWERGVTIPTDQLRKAQPLRAGIPIGEHHSQALGPDIIPTLLDAKVIGMSSRDKHHRRGGNRWRSVRTVLVVPC